jgi:uncharacterized protein (TIRG00374 family)
MKKKLFLLVKALISIALISYLLSKTEFAAVFASIKSANPFYLLLAFITLYFGKLLTGIRWQRLLAAQGIHIRLRTLIASLFVGQFFNNFLPTTVGGDAVRAYDTSVASKETAKSVTTVFLDRLIGVLALALLAVLALGVGYLLQEDVADFVLPVMMVFFVCLGGFVVIFNDTLANLIDRLLRKVKLSKIADKIYKAYQSVHELKHDHRTMWFTFIISLFLQINVVLFHYFISVSLDLNVSLLYYFIVVPVALTILILPFSINGIGLREGIFVFLLAPLNVPTHDAIALSWLSFGLLLTQGIIGGIIFALRGINFRGLRASRPTSPDPGVEPHK